MPRILDHLPDGFLDTPARELHRVLDGPTLIHLDGRRRPPLFASVLLHGNEDVGLVAIQRLLRDYAGRELPRALSIFVGNVAAAREGRRRLDGQPDFNRVWSEDVPDSPERRMAREVTERMQATGVFASVDVHNNTGINPHYGCINRLEPQFLHLAALFNRTAVYFIHPPQVQSMAFARFCPAITLECGKTGSPGSEAHAHEYLDACLNLAGIPDHPVAEHDLDLYHTVARVTVPDHLRIGFADPGADVSFLPELDHLNFRDLSAGTPIADLREATGPCPDVHDEHGRAVTGRYFECRDGRLYTRRPFLPAMLTRDTRIIRQDCLCYIMERYDWREGPVSSE